MENGHKKTLLLVEDEFLIAAAQKMSLENYGYSVILAKNGTTALEKFRNEKNIDLVLMDINLGEELDGTEIAAALLKEKEIPVVFLSSHTEPDVVEKTEKITSYGYVVKNSNVAVLDASIKMAFKLYDAKKLIIESEIKQKAMIANSSDVICIVDADAFIKYASPNIENLFGWKAEEMTDLKWTDYIHEADADRITSAFEMMLSAANGTSSLEVKFRHHDGTSRDINVTGTNLLDDAVIGGVLLNFHDVSDRKKTETQLDESRILFHRLIESLPQNIYAKDTDGRFIFANRHYCESMNISLEDLAGKTDFDLHPAAVAIKYQADDRRVIENNTVFEAEEEHHPLHGNSYFVRIIKAPFQDSAGSITGVLGIFWDITQRKKMEMDLRSSEQRYLSLFNGMTEGFALHVLVYDENENAIDYRFLDVNHAFERLTGIKRDDILGRRQSAVMPGEDRFWLETYSEVVKTGNPVHVEHYSPVLDKYFGVYSYSPAPDQFAVIFSDITERKKAEKEIEKQQKLLQESIEELEATNEELNASIEELVDANNELLEKDRSLQNERIFTDTLFECIPGYLYVYDETGLLVRWNTKHEKMTGYTTEELSKMTIDDWFEGEDLEKVKKAVEKVFKEGYGEVEAWLLKKDRTKILVQSNGVLLESEGKKYFTGIGIDITDKRKSEEDLREIHERFLKISSCLPGYIAFVNAATLVYEFVNEEYVKSFGMSKEEIIGNHVKNVVGEKSYKFAEKYITEACSGNTVSYENIFKFVNGERWVKVNFAPVYGSDGGVSSIAVFGYDITDSKNSAEQIRLLLEEKDVLLKEVYHRIKNNMSTIHSLLNMQSASINNPEVGAAFLDAATRIRSMMLLYDKLYQSVDFRETSVREYISILVEEIVRNFPNSSNVKIICNITDFKMDARKLQTVGIIINELLTNIMKYAFKGKTEGEITVSVDSGHGGTVFRVHDNGNGMPESVNFENSTGFGLKLVEMLTKHLEGKIRIERANGTDVILEFKDLRPEK